VGYFCNFHATAIRKQSPIFILNFENWPNLVTLPVTMKEPRRSDFNFQRWKNSTSSSLPFRNPFD
jgi:hypothetical protein